MLKNCAIKKKKQFKNQSNDPLESIKTLSIRVAKLYGLLLRRGLVVHFVLIFRKKRNQNKTVLHFVGRFEIFGLDYEIFFFCFFSSKIFPLPKAKRKVLNYSYSIPKARTNYFDFVIGIFFSRFRNCSKCHRCGVDEDCGLSRELFYFILFFGFFLTEKKKQYSLTLKI